MIGIKPQDPKTAITKSLQRAQQTGSIVLNNLELVNFPKEICDIDNLRFDQAKWWEINPITKIDLSFNQIKEIPPHIAILKDITMFRMSNNTLEYIPDELFSLQTLKMIEFSNNKIKSIPLKMLESYSLVEINLQSNMIESLPNNWRQLKNIEILNLSGNKITRFEISPGDFMKLKRLDLSNNLIVELKGQMDSLIELEYLSLAKNKLTYIPNDMLKPLKNIKIIDLKENKLTQFICFPLSNKLDSVFLAYNQLNLVKGYENCPSLTVLDFKNNKLVTLDKSIYALKNLKTLDLMNNDLSDIPSEIGFLTQLVRINIEGNPLKCIRSSIKSGGTEQLKKYLRERNVPEGETKKMVQEFEKIANIDVFDQFIKDFLIGGRELSVIGQNLKEIPNKFCSLNLTLLDLSKNDINTINPNIANLKGLQKLRINMNKIEVFPTQVLINFNNLEELELKGNKLTNLFEGIPAENASQFFPRLKHVDLSTNRLEKIPEMLTKLSSLRLLGLAYNKIVDISNITNDYMVNLDVLDLSNNKLEIINDDIYKLSKLEHLNIENNSMTKIPTVLGCMENLKNLKIYGNPVKNIKRDIMDKPSKFILEYLRDKHPVPISQMQANNRQLGANTKNVMEIEEPNQGYNMGNDYNQPMNTKIQQNAQRMNQNTMATDQSQGIYAASSKNVRANQGQTVEEFKETQNIGISIQQIQEEIMQIDKTISKLEEEIRDNYNMSKPQQMLKRKEINNLRANKNKLLNMIQKQ